MCVEGERGEVYMCVCVSVCVKRESSEVCVCVWRERER